MCIFAGSLFAVLISPDNLSLSFFFDTAQSNTLTVAMLRPKVVAFRTGMGLVSLEAALNAMLAAPRVLERV
ncbi:hypothetical protein [Bradyrhizobium sp. CCBAU 051011]|uniref:hypothetical protein n=1 Tax=Bradyrhizobium sp. CCBAU 051011 TaxID=858422 RepID=UPI001379FF42|nr:hypothetical protein [Bradyrhizobium sp. CCBAU 051011]